MLKEVLAVFSIKFCFGFSRGSKDMVGLKISYNVKDTVIEKTVFSVRKKLKIFVKNKIYLEKAYQTKVKLAKKYPVNILWFGKYFSLKMRTHENYLRKRNRQFIQKNKIKIMKIVSH